MSDFRPLPPLLYEPLVEAALREDLARRLPPGASEARNMVEAGGLIARAALARTESRGAHFRSDYPEPDPAWEGPLPEEP